MSYFLYIEYSTLLQNYTSNLTPVSFVCETFESKNALTIFDFSYHSQLLLKWAVPSHRELMLFKV